MTKAIDRLKAERHEISNEVLAAVSPYQTSHINRFGQYHSTTGEHRNHCRLSASPKTSRPGWFRPLWPPPVDIRTWVRISFESFSGVKNACPDFARMRSLVMTFRGILQAGKVASLARWMKKANGSGIYGMKRFVRKLNHDLAAVKNALRESWSNGPVEGHINRLKTLKRQMYGPAGFELLRARLLPMARGSPLHRNWGRTVNV
jgi:hypothetical protein